MSDRLIKDVTQEYEHMRCELLLIRVTLGLSPAHDVLTCVRTLFEQGREEMEKLRGPKSDDSSYWAPR